MDVRLGLLFVLLLAGNCAYARPITHYDLSGLSKKVDFCTLCEEYSSMALDYLTENKTQVEIIEALHDACSELHTLKEQLDSLKPKESLVIRQRYGLDGKGDRTLGEIAGNLNISREMVRKYEMKALMKLKHPARVDYLRRYIY